MLIRRSSPHWLEPFWPAMAAPGDSLFGELGRLFSAEDWRAGERDAYRFTDVQLKNEENQLSLSVNLPGIKESDIKLTVTADRLQLQGERKLDVPEGFRARHRERQSYKFERSFRLPTSVDPDRVEAKLTHGVLTVTMPKTESNKPRTIAVHSA